MEESKIMEERYKIRIPLINIYTIIITLIFILMQHLEIINWHWIWIISPLWIPLAITLAIIIFVYICKFILYLID